MNELVKQKHDVIRELDNIQGRGLYEKEEQLKYKLESLEKQLSEQNQNI